MPSFLECVADLTDPRDIVIDGRLASVVLEHVGASTVALWRWAARENEVTLGERLTATTLSDLSLDSIRPEIRACRLAAPPSRRLDFLDGQWHHLYPLTDKDENGLALEIAPTKRSMSRSGPDETSSAPTRP